MRQKPFLLAFNFLYFFFLEYVLFTSFYLCPFLPNLFFLWSSCFVWGLWLLSAEEYEAAVSSVWSAREAWFVFAVHQWRQKPQALIFGCWPFPNSVSSPAVSYSSQSSPIPVDFSFLFSPPFPYLYILLIAQFLINKNFYEYIWPMYKSKKRVKPVIM